MHTHRFAEAHRILLPCFSKREIDTFEASIVSEFNGYVTGVSHSHSYFAASMRDRGFATLPNIMLLCG